MKNRILKAAALFIMLGPIAANASVIINVTEVGGDVVFDTSGSLDLTGASFLGGIGYDDGFISGGPTGMWPQGLETLSITTP